jgi:hypothetical protein
VWPGELATTPPALLFLFGSKPCVQLQQYNNTVSKINMYAITFIAYIQHLKQWCIINVKSYVYRHIHAVGLTSSSLHHFPINVGTNGNYIFNKTKHKRMIWKMTEISLHLCDNFTWFFKTTPKTKLQQYVCINLFPVW